MVRRRLARRPNHVTAGGCRPQPSPSKGQAATAPSKGQAAHLAAPQRKGGHTEGVARPPANLALLCAALQQVEGPGGGLDELYCVALCAPGEIGGLPRLPPCSAMHSWVGL